MIYPTTEEWEIIKANVAAKKAAIDENLPSWSQVETKFDNDQALIDSMTNLAEAEIILTRMLDMNKKIARVVYWLAKGTQD